MIDRIPPQQGHTLAETLLVLGIVAVAAGTAVPSFRELLQDSRRDAAVSTLLQAVHLARQFAAVRGEPVSLCGSRDDRGCSGETDWSAGLLLVDAGGGLRRSLPLMNANRGTVVRSNRAVVGFEAGSGFASPATLTICDGRGSGAARAVIVSRTGRPRPSARDASGRPLAC
jgi:type IV fimbrial biogenesis protein FimT